MEHEDIKVLIVKRGGFQTLEQIKAEFENEDMEVLEAKLTFLVERTGSVKYLINLQPVIAFFFTCRGSKCF